MFKPRYTTCCAANVYMFVYILIGTPIVPVDVVDIKIRMILYYYYGDDKSL